MEYMTFKDDETSTCLMMAYSMIGRTIPAGRHAIAYVGDATLDEIVLSDKWGNNVNALYQMPTVIETISPTQQPVKREGIYDLMGRRIVKPSKGVYISNGKKVCY